MKYTKDKKFVEKMFDEISPTYDKLNHLLSGYQDKRWRKKAVNNLSSFANIYNNILDLAAGSGDLGMELLSLNPAKLYSVDLSYEMLMLNKEKLPAGINCTLKSDAEHLPFRDNYFDLCGIAFGVRNFENLQGCIKEINRVLKPGGKFLTIEMFKPEKESITNKSFRIYFEKLVPKIGNAVSKSDYAYNYLFDSVDNFVSAAGYCELLEKNRFKKINMKNNFLGIVYTVIAEKV